MAKVGILGGTFNPIHTGHLLLAKNAYNQLQLDKVLIMPSGVSYFKINNDVQSKDVRADMVKLAIEEYPYFEFSDIELKREGNTYTYETLEQLKETNPDDTYYFIIGADTLFSIEKWKFPERIFSKCIIVVMVRDDCDINDVLDQCNYLKSKYLIETIVLNADKIDISSTLIRNQIRDGLYDTNSDYLPKGVYSYIVNNNLYKN